MPHVFIHPVSRRLKRSVRDASSAHSMAVRALAANAEAEVVHRADEVRRHGGAGHADSVADGEERGNEEMGSGAAPGMDGVRGA